MKRLNGIENTSGFNSHLQSPAVDLLVSGYLFITGFIFFVWGFGNTRELGMVFVHLSAIGFIWVHRAYLFRDGLGRHPVRAFLHAWYPAIALPFIYRELEWLNALVHNRFYDQLIFKLELFVFRNTTPVNWFSRQVDNFWISEFLHFSYIFYYLMIPILGFALLGEKKYREFQAYMWTLLFTFFFCYFWFIFFPVEGPRYWFPPLSEHLRVGVFYRMAHTILEHGASRGAAFPSSHVAAALVTVFCAWRWSRKTLPILLPLGIGLTLGTVYGRFHYGVDALAGLLVALFFGWFGPWTFERMTRMFSPNWLPPFLTSK